jgi:hypothetical protein
MMIGEPGFYGRYAEGEQEHVAQGGGLFRALRFEVNVETGEIRNKRIEDERIVLVDDESEPGS